MSRDVGALVAQLVEQLTGRAIDECDWRDLLHARDSIDRILTSEINRLQANDRGGAT